MHKKNYPRKVRKRDGSIVNFDAAKIRHAIARAALETVGDKKKAAFIAEIAAQTAVERLSRDFKGRIPGIEDIQNIVETSLMEEGFGQVA